MSDKNYKYVCVYQARNKAGDRCVTGHFAFAITERKTPLERLATLQKVADAKLPADDEWQGVVILNVFKMP